MENRSPEVSWSQFDADGDNILSDDEIWNYGRTLDHSQSREQFITGFRWYFTGGVGGEITKEMFLNAIASA